MCYTGANMKPKRGETAEQTISRWAVELLMSTSGKTFEDMSSSDFDRALEMISWLKDRVEFLKAYTQRREALDRLFDSLTKED